MRSLITTLTVLFTLIANVAPASATIWRQEVDFFCQNLQHFVDTVPDPGDTLSFLGEGYECWSDLEVTYALVFITPVQYEPTPFRGQIEVLPDGGLTMYRFELDGEVDATDAFLTLHHVDSTVGVGVGRTGVFDLVDSDVNILDCSLSRPIDQRGGSLAVESSTFTSSEGTTPTIRTWNGSLEVTSSDVQTSSDVGFAIRVEWDATGNITGSTTGLVSLYDASGTIYDSTTGSVYVDGSELSMNFGIVNGWIGLFQDSQAEVLNSSIEAPGESALRVSGSPSEMWLRVVDTFVSGEYALSCWDATLHASISGLEMSVGGWLDPESDICQYDIHWQ